MRIRYSVAAGAAMVVAVAGVASAAPGDTTVTFSVSGGSLAISVPGPAGLGSGSPGSSVSGQLGSVTATDTRALLAAAWTASVTSTSFTTGGATSAETVPTSAISYWSGTASPTPTGVGTFTPGQATSSQAQTLDSSRTAYSLSAGTGNNTATWNPTLVVAIPAGAVNGIYTGTVTHSIS
ncbi:hypothetical protein [Kitasatospora sp. NPDC050543]|uniref:hypothetical protein n=1 Tax=Kitasatospora sp. NPDC050543 TaxID=3364054 RepID=UPI0037A12E24